MNGGKLLIFTKKRGEKYENYFGLQRLQVQDCKFKTANYETPMQVIRKFDKAIFAIMVLAPLCQHSYTE